MRLLSARAGVALTVISLVNCTAWHATQEPFSDLEGKEVRITTIDGIRQEGKLADADSLAGSILQIEVPYKNRSGAIISSKHSISSIDTSKIAVVEKRVPKPGGTAALIVAGLLVIGIVVLATTPFYGDEFYDH